MIILKVKKPHYVELTVYLPTLKVAQLACKLE